MPQTISVRFPNAKRSYLLMEDAGLTLNDKGEVVRTSDLVPPSSSGTVVAAALLALADSSNKDLYLPAIHAPPGPYTNCFFQEQRSYKVQDCRRAKGGKGGKAEGGQGEEGCCGCLQG